MNVDSVTTQSQTYADRPVCWFLGAAAFWAVLAAAVSVLLSLLLVMPKLFYELGDSAQHLSFGRLYPLQMQVLVYGLLGNGFFAFVFFAAQRLCRVRLAMSPLCAALFVVWQAILVAAILASIQLQTQGRWLGWMSWPLDVAFLFAWVFLFIPVVAMTLSRRDASVRLAPALWFAMSAVIAIPILQLLNNVEQGGQSLYIGVQDVMVQWWFSRGLVTYWMTVPAVAMLYYLVPLVSRGVLYSHRLTVIHFWSIALLGCWGGNFQWHLTAVPGWANSLAMFAGLLLWLGCFAGGVNLLRSLPQDQARKDRSVARRLTTASVVCYLLYCVDSAYMSLKLSTLTTQFTDWSTANQMLAIFGVSGLSLIAFSMLIIPAVSSLAINHSRGNWLRYLAIGGAAFQVIALYAAGRTQAFSWHQLNDLGRLEYPEFTNALSWVWPLWAVVAFGAVLWLVAMLFWLGLMLKTILSTASSEATIPAASSVANNDPTTEPSRLVGAPVLGAAIGLENWTQLAWHSVLERHGKRMAVRVFAAVSAGTVLIWLPSFIFRGTPADASTLTQSPYTELELLGRDIYIREGCASCHTQATRPLVPEVLRYGTMSQATDYAFDRPAQIGFRRVGPDLAREGGRQSSLWHWQHLENPQSVTPDSIMPSFGHVLGQKLDFSDNDAMMKQAESIAADIVSQGGPVMFNDELIMDSHGIALIAYLQRLGTVSVSSEPVGGN